MLLDINVASHKGPYKAIFSDNPWAYLAKILENPSHVIIDKEVAKIYAKELYHLNDAASVLELEATEYNKSLASFSDYIDFFIRHNVRRDHNLIAIGGGIIQDITCFIAAILLRGLPWFFFPTTLLSQADSCIGSKSCINAGNSKNIVGTFTPPAKVIISTLFLQSLDKLQLCSGVGEILKIHAIDSPETFQEIANNYDEIFHNSDMLKKYIYNSLKIKKDIIELDEFDKDLRHILNYGHTFGHAIESATDFAIPHGIAISIGMDLANYLAYRISFGSEFCFSDRHPCLQKNYRDFEQYHIPLDRFFIEINKDKKNQTENKLTLILPDKNSKISKYCLDNSPEFRQIVTEYFTQQRSL